MKHIEVTASPPHPIAQFKSERRSLAPEEDRRATSTNPDNYIISRPQLPKVVSGGRD